MKKLRILLVIMIMVVLFGVQAYAADAQVQIVGESKAKAGDTKTVTVKVTNSEAVGVVEGNIAYDDNIESLQVSPSYNGWTVNYNTSTGKFNTLNASGTKDGEVLQITYKLKSNATSGKITLSNLTLTTIAYNTITVPETVEKKITVETTPANTPEDETNKGTNEGTNGAANQGEGTPAVPSNTNSAQNPTQTPASTQQGTNGASATNTNKQTTTTNGETKDKSTANTVLPKTGKTRLVAILMAICVIFAIIMYTKNKKYKGIK